MQASPKTSLGQVSGGFDAGRWAAERLPLLDGICPLLPGGPDKRPLVGDGWHEHQGLSIDKLQAVAPECVCWHVGADPGHIGIDIDGAKAAAFCQSHGCEPYTADTWRIIRTSNSERLKLVFTVTPEQKATLVAGNKTVHIDGQEFAVFAKPGTQIVVLGNHYTKESNYTENDDQYAWAGRNPADAQPLPPEWFALLTGVFCGDRPLKPPTRRQVSAPSSRKANAYSSSGGWSNSSSRQPCPVCGRDHSGACSINSSGAVWCCHGETKSAPDCSRTGEKITGSDGQQWGYVRTEEHDSFGERSLFVPHQPRQSRTAKTVKTSGQMAGTPAAPGKVTTTTAADYSRPIRLETHQVMEWLPKRIGQLRLNVRSGDVIAEHTEGPITLSGNDIGRLYLQLSSQAEKWPKDTTADAVALLAGQSPFDPVAEYLNTNTTAPLPMEQWQRLDQHLLGIDDPIAAAFLPRYLISAVARVFSPGCYVRQTPVLIGKQERGKSELGRILFGADHWVEGIGELGKDDLMKAHTAWGVELAELDGVTRRADQERLKAFLTEKTDTYRKPYDRAPEAHHRRFVFWGTSNGAPLRDTTGSTRFVCIPIPDRLLPLDWARQNRSAIWSRAVEQYKAGIDWIHTDEPMRAAIAERNSNFQEIDPWADDIAAYLEQQQRLGQLPVRVTQVLEQMKLPKDRQNAATAKRVTAIAEQLGWVHGRRIVNKRKLTGLWPAAEDTGHPGHPLDTPMGVLLNTSDSNASNAAGHPGHPYSPTLSKVVMEQEPQQQPAAAPAPTPDTFGQIWVSGVSAAKNACAGAAFSNTDGCPDGCPQGCPVPDWHKKARLLHQADPAMAYATLALRLQTESGVTVTGRQVRQVLEQAA
jgi:predicted P-loop ATPase